MMRRTVRLDLLVASLVLAPLLMGGCHLVAGPPDGRQDWWYFCDETGCYRCNEWGCELPNSNCSTHHGCPSGTICDPMDGLCKTNRQCKLSSECGSGMICQSGTCVPGKSPCTANSGCGDGAYCSNGSCRPSGLCDEESDCAKYGSNFVCDARGTCVPSITPPPPTCQTASACSDGLCLDGSCATCSANCGGAITCQFNKHCGEGRVCLNGQCTSSCSTAQDCGSGQTCKSLVCVTDTSVFCTRSTDCGSGKVCLNNSCLPGCPAGACTSTKDICGAPMTAGAATVRLCQPNTAAKPECTVNKDCTGGELCVNGVCRTSCTKVEDCAVCPDGPVCGKGGFCMTAIENAPQCATNAQCAGKVCLNGQCTSL